MKRYPIKPPVLMNWPDETVKIVDPVISEISVDSLIDIGLLVLYRQIKQLSALSAKGKLDAPSARDLRDHVKLLFEIKDREADLLRTLTPEQLQQLIDKIKEPDGSSK